jgi:hypothetical protein
MIFASPSADIVQDDPVTTTFATDEAHQLPAEVSRESDAAPSPEQPPEQRDPRRTSAGQ